MSHLSPASQAVWDAFNDAYEDTSFADFGECLAAALRALAVRIHGADRIRQDIIDIANELES